MLGMAREWIPEIKEPDSQHPKYIAEDLFLVQIKYVETPWCLSLILQVREHKFLELTHSYRQLWESLLVVIHRHSHGQAPSEQCKATHPVCVTLQPLGPLSPQTASTTQTASLLQHSGVDPHSSGPTLLISSATFSYADACNQVFLPPPHLLQSALHL